ncbi:MAG: hypothetical protein ABIT38_01555 [Gemmatimonadaceae bacterium]
MPQRSTGAIDGDIAGSRQAVVAQLDVPISHWLHKSVVERCQQKHEFSALGNPSSQSVILPPHLTAPLLEPERDREF